MGPKSPALLGLNHQICLKKTLLLFSINCNFFYRGTSCIKPKFGMACFIRSLRLERKSSLAEPLTPRAGGWLPRLLEANCLTKKTQNGMRYLIDTTPVEILIKSIPSIVLINNPRTTCLLKFYYQFWVISQTICLKMLIFNIQLFLFLFLFFFFFWDSAQNIINFGLGCSSYWEKLLVNDRHSILFILIKVLLTMQYTTRSNVSQ